MGPKRGVKDDTQVVNFGSCIGTLEEHQVRGGYKYDLAGVEFDQRLRQPRRDPEKAAGPRDRNVARLVKRWQPKSQIGHSTG